MFPNEKREFSAGRCTAQKGGLRKRAGWAAQRDSPLAHPFPQPSLMCSPLACPIVQHASPPFCALASPRKIHVFTLATWPSSPLFSVIHCLNILICGTNFSLFFLKTFRTLALEIIRLVLGLVLALGLIKVKVRFYVWQCLFCC